MPQSISNAPRDLLARGSRSDANSGTRRELNAHKRAAAASPKFGIDVSLMTADCRDLYFKERGWDVDAPVLGTGSGTALGPDGGGR